MLTGRFQSLVILVVVVTFYGMDFLLIRRYDRQRQTAKSGRAWDFTVAMVLAACALVVQPLWLPWLGFSTQAGWGLALQMLGVILLIASFVLHLWARLHLGRFYAERVEILPDHHVVQSGPYAYIRHPVVTSFFGIAIGLFLVNPAIPTLLMMLYVFGDFARAAIQEEKLLSQHLSEYRAYMQRTGRFLPRWRKQ